MDSEFNDLSTNNLETTFSNSPNNLETSDELTASENYVTKMGTNHSIAKGVNRAIVTTALSVSISTGGYMLLTNSMVHNPTTIDNVSFTYKENIDSLHYEFFITNTNEYPTTFSIYYEKDKVVIFTLDVTKEGVYQGDVTSLGYDRTVVYDVSYKANDYIGTLYKGKVTFKSR